MLPGRFLSLSVQDKTWGKGPEGDKLGHITTETGAEAERRARKEGESRGR